MCVASGTWPHLHTCTSCPAPHVFNHIISSFLLKHPGFPLSSCQIISPFPVALRLSASLELDYSRYIVFWLPTNLCSLCLHSCSAATITPFCLHSPPVLPSHQCSVNKPITFTQPCSLCLGLAETEPSHVIYYETFFPISYDMLYSHILNTLKMWCHFNNIIYIENMYAILYVIIYYD